LNKRKEKPEFICEPLGPVHDRAAFSCGTTPLDVYLKTQARQDIEKNLAAVFILTKDGRTVAGYYTLSQYSVEADTIPEEIKRKLTKHHSIPATLIGRLARNAIFRGQGVGELLLMDALKRPYIHSKQIASWAVIVDAKDDQAVAFYKKYGFMEILNNPRKLFLPMSTVSKLVE
jgi:predicted GNAT family N-acyltransferase